MPFGGYSSWAKLGKNQPYHINTEMAADLLIKIGTSGPPAEDCLPDLHNDIYDPEDPGTLWKWLKTSF